MCARSCSAARGVVGGAGTGAVAVGDCGAPRQVVVGIGGKSGRPQFPDRGRTVQAVIGIVDPEAGVRPRDTRAVARVVVGVGQRPAACRTGRYTIGVVRGIRVAAAYQSVQSVIRHADCLAIPLAQLRQIAVLVIAVLLVVGAVRHIGRCLVRIERPV